jgi:hypothetical protein
VEEVSFAKGEAGVARSEPGDVMEFPQCEPFCHTTLVLGVGERDGLKLPDIGAEAPDGFARNTGDAISDHV